MQGVEPRLGVFDARAGVGVGRQPFRQPPAAARLADPVERLEDVRHLAHVVVLIERVSESRLVGLVLGVAAVLEEQDAEPLARQPGHAGDVGREDAPQPQAELRQLGLADLLHRVAVGDVADLVADHRGQLRLVVDRGHQPTGHVDEATRQREGVDRGVIHHVELPGQVRTLRGLGHLHPDLGHVRLHRRILVEADGLGHLLRGLLAHLDLLGLGDEGQLVLAGHRIAGAAAGHQRQPRGHHQSGDRSDNGTAHHGRSSVRVRPQ